MNAVSGRLDLSGRDLRHRNLARSQWRGVNLCEADLSCADLEQVNGEQAGFRRNHANPIHRMTMTFTGIAPVGLLVPLVSADLLRNSRFLPARRG